MLCFVTGNRGLLLLLKLFVFLFLLGCCFIIVVVFRLFVCCCYCCCCLLLLLLFFNVFIVVCFCDLLDFVTETDPDFLGRLHACTVTINRPVTDDYEWIIHTEQPP